jgi:cleavage and polyadenylation specificity factor subunit 3
MPYFLEKTGFKGKVFMTHPTKSIYNYIAQDFVKVSNISTDE